MSKGDIWVRVDHAQQNVTKFINDGQPFTKNGAYMSLGYFKKLQGMMSEVNNYTIVDKT